MHSSFFGGIFSVLIYDNLTTAVRKVLQGKSRIELESFRKFKAYHSFDARLTNAAAGHEKGGVEGLVGFARRNYMVPVPEAANIEELNAKLLDHCNCHAGDFRPLLFAGFCRRLRLDPRHLL